MIPNYYPVPVASRACPRVKARIVDVAQTQCQQIVRRAGSNFSAAFRFLDSQQRRGMTALYAFCRVVDDVADEAGTPEAKRAALEGWRRVIAREQPCFARNDMESVSQELQWAVATFDIPEQYLLDLVDGVAKDIDTQPMVTLKDLLDYCYGVAGTVGLSCLRIFRVEETEVTRRAALALANAFQLTNIIRDVREDAARGRMYLPVEDIDRLGLTPDLMAFEAARASGYYLEAWREFPQAAWHQLKPARLMSAYYRAILRKIERNPAKPWRERVTLHWWEKLALMVGVRS